MVELMTISILLQLIEKLEEDIYDFECHFLDLDELFTLHWLYTYEQLKAFEKMKRNWCLHQEIIQDAHDLLKEMHYIKRRKYIKSNEVRKSMEGKN